MTDGSIVKHLISFAVPLMIGNIFQLLYNTIDSIVVGHFVGKEALAAVGSTGTIINVLVMFFNGISIGAGVVISRYFGAKDNKNLHTSVETTMAMTFIFSVIFTLIGVLGVKPMLHFMSTPEDVFDAATIYLRIYFAGISGLLIYNMGSGILRAVGDTKRPLMFLILCSVLNTILDLVFVIFFKMGISGVGYATIISQFISAFLILVLLTKTDDIYKLVWKDLSLNMKIFKQILDVGLPTAIQSMITSFSNVFVQSYVNVFGSSIMAAWSCLNRVEQYIFFPIQSMSSAATTFVSQNIGAGKPKRADKGTWVSIGLIVGLTVITATVAFIFAEPATAVFTSDSEVIYYGALFTRLSAYFLILNSINHTLAGALRGRGNSKAPMVIMLIAFVAIRQIYLYIGTMLVDSVYIVGLAYPVGWTSCCIIELLYYKIKIMNPNKENAS
ncbi:MAG: MATE family efflux transporter [Lachnospiraceae bacterium]|nr:MATE family efflux transporter [Lachnospiraceae bacterium]